MKTNRFIGAMLILAGTCIGAGMLALPLTSAASGFYFSLVLLFTCWLFTYFSALWVTEVNLWLHGEPSFISMAKMTLGRTGEIITWISFLLLFYSLLAAYIAGGSALIHQALKILFNIDVKNWISAVIWVLCFSAIVFSGTHTVDYINRFLMIGKITTFALLVAIVFPHTNSAQIDGGQLKYTWLALPVLLTAYGYHIVIPSLRHYLGGDTRKLIRAIFWGSLLALVVYIIWEYVIFGIIPIRGENSLTTILKTEEPVTGLTTTLSQIIANDWVNIIVRFMAFFALGTSLLGVSLGLFDLLADGVKQKKNFRGRLSLAIFTFVPPLIYALIYPNGFVMALGYAGVFVAVLHGLLPIAMAWRGRKLHANELSYKTPGGYIMMILAGLFFLSVIVADIISNMHWISLE